jgi:hypothetical protein
MNCGVWQKAADLVLEPDVNGYKYDDFEHSKDLIRAGEAVTREALPEIRKWLHVEVPARPSKSRKPQLAQAAALPAD